MIIEIYQELTTIDFKSYQQNITLLTDNEIIHSSRDWEYNLNINAIKEGILEITIYITHQQHSTSKMLVSYIGSIKAFLIKELDTDSDKQQLIDFIELNTEVATNIVAINEPRINVVLKAKLKTSIFCDKIIASLTKIGFYK